MGLWVWTRVSLMGIWTLWSSWLGTSWIKFGTSLAKDWRSLVGRIWSRTSWTPWVIGTWIVRTWIAQEGKEKVKITHICNLKTSCSQKRTKENHKSATFKNNSSLIQGMPLQTIFYWLQSTSVVVIHKYLCKILLYFFFWVHRKFWNTKKKDSCNWMT